MEAGSGELTEPSQGNKMEDTVTLARQEREKQGPWEAEVSYGGEADLHRHLSRCDKNPGHQNFIPADQFNVDHLPPGCRDTKLVDFVRAVSDLTVRVSVKYVSDSRPETDPGSDKPYPFYRARCRDMLRTGSGFVYEVDDGYPSKYGRSYATCKYKECVNSPTQKTQFAHIYVHTAAHVVYDNLEAAQTTCHLFFDNGNSPEVCSGVVTLSGWSISERQLKRDCCYLRYITHDLDLAKRLKKTLTHYEHLAQSIQYMDNLLLSAQPHPSREQCLQGHTRDTKSLYMETIIVSHPHGCSKQVSFGCCTHLEKRKDGLDTYTYTTPTCPGSSGAHICLIAKEGIFFLFNGYIHSGGHSKGSRQLNFSTYGHYIV